MNMPISSDADCTYRLDELSNEALLATTRMLVGASNQVLAALLAHLGEVQARGVHRERACASLYTYCLYELRFSEDEAFRRAKAARIVRDFPKLLGAVARGELHLTGLLMLGPHLTDENQDELLAQARHRTKREIAALVRKLDPLPDVPPRIEPLGPAPARWMGPANPDWADLTKAFSGPVRELAEAERPGNWMRDELAVKDAPEPEPQPEPQPERQTAESMLSAPQRYKVELTASQEYVDLLEQARDLLSHAVPNASMDEIHVRALRVLVAELQKKKYGASDQPHDREPAGDSGEPCGRGRHIPAAVRRTVAKRDGGRCTYVDPVTGRRCRETTMLELHHQHAHALGGPATAKNVTLRCRAHNALAAEQDFGRDYMLDKAAARAPDPRRRGAETSSDRARSQRSRPERDPTSLTADAVAGGQRAGSGQYTNCSSTHNRCTSFRH